MATRKQSKQQAKAEAEKLFHEIFEMAEQVKTATANLAINSDVNWNNVGSLGYIKEQLTNILEHTGGDE